MYLTKPYAPVCTPEPRVAAAPPTPHTCMVQVAQLEANTKVSDANTLGTPRNLDGFILEKVREGGREL